MFFATSHHIVGEQVCIRSERGFCGISYTACADMVGALYIAEYFAKLGYIRISSKFSVENHNKQVHNQSESFTVSEAGLAGGGEPVVKVSDKTL